MALSDFLLSLAGKAEQLELRTTVQARLAIEGALAGAFGGELITAITSGGKQGLFTDTATIAGHVVELLDKSESEIGKIITDSLVAKPLGVNLDNVAPENRAGVDTIRRVIGFAAELSLGTAAVSGALEPLLGSHGLGKMLEFVKSIPDEIGLNYFMGTVMANVFESATSGPLREAILEQARSSRLEWPQISRLLRMHEISDADATDRLRKAGFRDPDITILKQLDRQLLSVSELQQLYESDYIDDPTFRNSLQTLGFASGDIDKLVKLTHHRAAVSGEGTVRNAALRQFRDGTMSESAFRAVLQQTETPKETINQLVNVVKLEHNVRQAHLSTVEIRDLWLNKHISTDEARARLQKLGLQDQDISDLILLWTDQKNRARSGLGTAKVLAYLAGGVIDKKTAYGHLVANGIDPADAQFLVDHPETHTRSTIKSLTESTVISAYKDGVISVDEATAKLKELNVSDDEIALRIATATAILSKGHKPKHATKTLAEGQVMDALKLGLASPEWAERELETLGYPADDAILLTAIELTRMDASWPTTNGWQPLN